MSNSIVVVVSYPDDFHAKYIMEKLEKLGIRNMLFNIGEYPSEIESAVIFNNNSPDTSYLMENLNAKPESIRSVWWRRPSGAYRDEPGTMKEKYMVSESESYIQSLPYFLSKNIIWVSNPEATRIASRKSYQLLVAQSVGWNIPRTFVGNSQEAVKNFLRNIGRKTVVMKPVCSSFVRLNPKKQDAEGLNGVIYAKRIPSSMVLDNLEKIPACPFILQEEVNKEFDIRVTVVGEKVFSSAIKTTTSGESISEEVDWRHYKHQSSYEYHQLPEHIAHLCTLVTKQLGLCFGCIDLGFSRQEGYTFFEINPQGQWLPSENIVGHDISGALIELLTEHT